MSDRFNPELARLAHQSLNDWMEKSAFVSAKELNSGGKPQAGPEAAGQQQPSPAAPPAPAAPSASQDAGALRAIVREELTQHAEGPKKMSASDRIDAMEATILRISEHLGLIDKPNVAAQPAPAAPPPAAAPEPKTAQYSPGLRGALDRFRISG